MNPKAIPTIIAPTEPITVEKPLTPHAQGTRAGTSAATRRKPVGNGMPRRKPRGATIVTATAKRQGSERPDAFALQNAFELSSGSVSGCYAIVNVGAEELGINAIKDGVSIFTRDSSYGGYQINEAIMSKLDVPYDEAEKIKLGGTKIEGKERGVIEEIYTSVVSGWVNENKRALDFLATTYPDQSIERILISGGSCRIPGFQKYLEMETDISVEELNPFMNLQISEKTFDPKYLSYMAPQAAVAVGLALRSIGDK